MCAVGRRSLNCSLDAVGDDSVDESAYFEDIDLGEFGGTRFGACPFGLAVLDLQVGSMGAMAVTMNLRLDESGSRIPHVPVVMLLDRVADVHLARRSGAEGWLIKPLDSLRLRRAVNDVLAGKTWHESASPVMQHS
ncbi:MAG: response regulator [Acidimicrobiia bacterium]|nr:response regulator [Acidimicrobiia bacterium]